jgi:hypothetical protein
LEDDLMAMNEKSPKEALMMKRELKLIAPGVSR